MKERERACVLRLLEEKGLKSVLRLCNETHSSLWAKIARCLLNVFSHFAGPEAVYLLLGAVFDDHLRQSAESATLLRLTSVTSFLFSYHAKNIAASLSLSVIKPKVVQLIQNPLHLEVQPHKVADAQQLANNQQILNNIAQQFLDDFMQAVKADSFASRHFRRTCSTLARCMREKFPAATLNVLSSFVFLRFFCPTLLDPTAFGIPADRVSPETQRSLIVVAKLIQSAANGVELGQNEAFMNRFILKNKDTIKRFLSEISVLPEAASTQSSPFVDASVEPTVGRLPRISSSPELLAANNCTTILDEMDFLVETLQALPQTPADCCEKRNDMGSTGDSSNEKEETVHQPGDESAGKPEVEDTELEMRIQKLGASPPPTFHKRSWKQQLLQVRLLLCTWFVFASLVAICFTM